jgi:hypothetical protein
LRAVLTRRGGQAASYETPLPATLAAACRAGPQAPAELTACPLPAGEVTAAEAQAACAAADCVCVVPAGTTLLLDGNLDVPALVIRGQLLWEGGGTTAAPRWLCAGYVVAEDSGRVQITAGADGLARSGAVVFIKDNGAAHELVGRRAFGAVHGAASEPGLPLLELAGRPLARTWSLLGAPVEEGGRELRLLHDAEQMGWRVGDRVALAATARQSNGNAQSFVIEALAGNIVTVAADSLPASCTGAADDADATPDCAADFALAADATRASCAGGCVFVGGSVGAANQLFGGAGRMRAEVVNLARSIVVTGDAFRHEECGEGECHCGNGRTQCTLGLHTIMHGKGTLKMSHSRVEKCGQRGIAGRYCVHMHFAEQCPDCLVHGNAVESSQQRGVIVHETHLSTVSENILYNVRGANYYIEDGNEMHNTLAHNVGICPNSLNGPLAGCTIPGTDNGEADTCLNQAGIWSLAHANHFVGNRMANSFNGLLFHSQFAGNGRGGVHGKVCTQHVPFGRVVGNTNHGHGRFGHYFLVSVYPRKVSQSLALNGITASDSCKALDAEGLDRGAPVPLLDATDVRAALGRLSALGVFLRKSVLYGAFVWARRALDSQKRRFLAWAVRQHVDGGLQPRRPAVPGPHPAAECEYHVLEREQEHGRRLLRAYSGRQLRPRPSEPAGRPGHAADRGHRIPRQSDLWRQPPLWRGRDRHALQSAVHLPQRDVGGHLVGYLRLRARAQRRRGIRPRAARRARRRQPDLPRGLPVAGWRV